MSDPTILIRPSLWRHLIVMSYDLLLLLACLLFATLPIVALNHGQAIHDGNPFFMLYLLSITFLFYGWFWTHGGQTLGMRTWRVRLVSRQGNTISWRQALFRFIAAALAWLPFGLGIVWPYIFRNQLSWPDALSASGLHYQAKSA